MNKKWMLFTCIMLSIAGLMGMESDKTAGASTDKPVRILDRERFDEVISMQYSPNGKSILTTTYTAGEYHASIWDAITGRLIHEWKAPQTIKAIAYSPDGKFILVTLWNAGRILNANTGEPISMKSEKFE